MWLNISTTCMFMHHTGAHTLLGRFVNDPHFSFQIQWLLFTSNLFKCNGIVSLVEYVGATY